MLSDAARVGREFFEREYDPHTTAPDGKEVMQRRLSLAAKARLEFAVERDIPYGATEMERLDVYPARGKADGVLVFIHGGYWQRLDKKDLAFLAESFVNAGITLVQVNYSLAPAVSLDTIVGQVRAACAWVWRNIGRFGGDNSRIYVGGNSAGGHLTAMMAATDWQSVHPDLPGDLMKGGLLVSGIYDLEPIRFTSINGAVQLDAGSAARNSPVRYRPTLSGRLLFTVGELESSEFQRQTRLLAAEWSSIESELMIAPKCHHYSILLELAHAGSALFKAARRLIQHEQQATEPVHTK